MTTPQSPMARNMTPEVRAKISATLKGRKLSAETRAKMSAGQKRRLPRSPEFREKMRAVRLGVHIRGVEVGYDTAHSRAQALLKDVECEMSDETCKGRPECALRHDAPEEFIRVGTGRKEGFRYYVGPNPLDGYIRLCRSHHYRYDRT